MPVPPAFTPAPDASPADWIVRGVRPWDRDRLRLWSFLPPVFEGYIRLPDRRNRPEQGVSRVAILTNALGEFTGTPDRCFVASWVGWGSWYPGSSATLVGFRPRRFGPRRWIRTPTRERLPRPRGPGRRARRRQDRLAEETRRTLNVIPQVHMEHREHYLFTARLDDVASFAINGFPEEPNLVWPEDRRWCLAKEVDGDELFVGGPDASVEALVANQSLLATRVPPDLALGPEAP